MRTNAILFVLAQKKNIVARMPILSSRRTPFVSKKTKCSHHMDRGMCCAKLQKYTLQPLQPFSRLSVHFPSIFVGISRQSSRAISISPENPTPTKDCRQHTKEGRFSCFSPDVVLCVFVCVCVSESHNPNAHVCRSAPSPSVFALWMMQIIRRILFAVRMLMYF